MNKVILCGNITKDIELRQTTNGKTVVQFTVATNKKVKDQTGQYKDLPAFHNLVAWGNIADNIARYFSKGSKILIEGELLYRNYQDKNNQTRYVTEIIVNNFYFVGSNTKREQDDMPVIEQEESLEIGNIPF